MDKQDHSLRLFQWAALGIVLLTVVTRLPSLLHPQPIINEAIYSVVANEIVDGGRPYVDAVERKPPLLFWTYAAIFEVAVEAYLMELHRAPPHVVLDMLVGEFTYSLSHV